MIRPEDTRPRERRSGETTTHHDQSLLPEAQTSPTGKTTPRVEPKLPHESDESASSQASATESHKALGEQAYRDTVGPSRDTDRGPVLDAIYNQAIAPRNDDVPPRR